MDSITKRWVRGSLMFTLALVLAAEGIFLYFMITSYYNYAGNAIRSQLSPLRSQLSLYTSSQISDKTLRLYRTVEQFDEKSRFALELIDANGNVVLTSSGVLPVRAVIPADIQEVVGQNGKSSASFVGQNENGEKVMAMTELTPYSAGGIVAMRLVTSLTLVDKAIQNLLFVSIALVAAIILASLVSGVYFIRSIVFPLQKIEATASRISKGDFDIRIENSSNDEIGSLCKTINNMAEELGQTEKLKNEFISSVSHELRTPLTSIKGWSETMGSVSTPDDPTFQRGMEIISHETDRLYDMVEELLDFSRMQNGLQLDLQLLDLAAEVEEATLLLGRRAGLLGISIDYAPPVLPVPVMADANRLRQVFVNIIDNAIKYSGGGDTITITLFTGAETATVRVADEGRGISPEDLVNVKIKFFKGQAAERGSGIGLAVADEIVKCHDGTLQIDSELGSGTVVTICLPLHKKG